MGSRKELQESARQWEAWETDELFDRVVTKLTLLESALKDPDFGAGDGENEGARYLVWECRDALAVIRARG